MSLILIFCPTGLCTRIGYVILPNFIIVNIISEKMHLKYEYREKRSKGVVEPWHVKIFNLF